MLMNIIHHLDDIMDRLYFQVFLEGSMGLSSILLYILVFRLSLANCRDLSSIHSHRCTFCSCCFNGFERKIRNGWLIFRAIFFVRCTPSPGGWRGEGPDGHSHAKIEGFAPVPARTHGVISF